MLRNYFKTAWRNLLKNKTSSFINISGLAVGMAVAMLIGFWIWDELYFNKSFQNYDRLAQVMQHQSFNGDVSTQQSLPYLIGNELKNSYGSDFKNVSMATWTYNRILAVGDKKLSVSGNFLEPQIIAMLSLKMIKGSNNSLNDNHSLILSSSAAKALFADEDPIGKTVKIDNRFDVKVTGLYEDLPYNSAFRDLTFIAPWQLYIDNNNWLEKTSNPWRNNSFQAFVQLADHADAVKVSTKIKDIKLKKISAEDAAHKPQVFLQPMSKWHLYSQFKNGVNTGGRIQFVWLFGTIGFFVLLLACINFMNLSTARSEKRAKEVGIRKSIGSMRMQLVIQFFSESLLVVAFAFVLSLILVQLAIPFFNDLADKKMNIPWSNPFFWLAGLGFSIITGLIAGSYPAFYLSSFKPVKVLKGTFKAGKLPAVPRQVLVVLQFTVSVVLIIGTIVVFRQVQFSKNRPVGYSREGLITIPVVTDEIHKHFEAVRQEIKKSNAVEEIAESSSPTTALYEFDGGFEWRGSSSKGDFGFIYASVDFGKTIGWHIKEGRDFSRDFPTDSSAFIVNEAAVKFMNLKNPVGEIIKADGKPYHIIAVVDDMVMESPYKPVTRTIFTLSPNAENVINVRINPAISVHEAVAKMEAVFKKYNPAQPFDYQFINDEYARKFSDEERIGKLAGVFAALAIFISCLGLFGMASFVAEQRTKEIGVRKVLGATVADLWGLLSKEFVLLVFISLLIASPLAYYFMHSWLQNYEYRTGLSWWIFAVAAIGALLITLCTVSFNAIKAAIANPVKSLRTE